jgi:pimeloyl-ACP methyl ester carboxylesterase
MRGGLRLRLHHEVTGEGHPIVLVHGWGLGSQRNWVETGWVDALAAVRRVVMLDVRGHGRSEKPLESAAYTYGAMGADVIQVLDDLGIEEADYLGYSMGAFMGAALLGSHPARFRSMVLGGIGDETPASEAACDGIAAALRADDPSSIVDPVGRAYRAFVDVDPTSDREALAVAALTMWPDGHPLDLAGAAGASADVPVLVVNGGNDHPYVDAAPRFVSALRDARYVVLPGADHVTALSDPGFRSAVLTFLAAR